MSDIFRHNPGYNWYRWRDGKKFHALKVGNDQSYPSVTTACGKVLNFRMTMRDCIYNESRKCRKCLEVIAAEERAAGG